MNEETIRQFISRMLWLSSEINVSDKGNVLDVIKMIEFHLSLREDTLKLQQMADLKLHLYNNVDGNKSKQILKIIESYENQKK
jgi:hypothetical protein